MVNEVREGGGGSVFCRPQMGWLETNTWCIDLEPIRGNKLVGGGTQGGWGLRWCELCGSIERFNEFCKGLEARVGTKDGKNGGVRGSCA